MTGDGKIRRVITGHDKNGKAIVVADGLAPSVRTNPLRPGHVSVDYAVVLDGEIYMVLDDTEVKLTTGDVVIQRGTNHAWSNRSGKPVRTLYVLIDGKFDAELAAQFPKGGDS